MTSIHQAHGPSNTKSNRFETEDIVMLVAVIILGVLLSVTIGSVAGCFYIEKQDPTILNELRYEQEQRR